MGTDIHIVIEYQSTDPNKKEWKAYCEMMFHPERDYGLFSKLSGVRYASEDTPIATRGLPKNCSAFAQRALGDEALHDQGHVWLEDFVYVLDELDYYRHADSMLDYKGIVAVGDMLLDNHNVRILVAYDS